MADEIKLGVDIEANLTKLDQMLNVAVQKTAVAGRAMQQSLSLTPGGGGGFGGDAVSQIASAKAGNAHIAGVQASFGGRLNASTSEQLAQHTANLAALKKLEDKSELAGFSETALGRLGISVASPSIMAIGAGAAAIRGGNFALENATQQLSFERSVRTSMAFTRENGNFGGYGAGESLRASQSAFDNLRVPGILGLVPGINTLGKNYIRYLGEKSLANGGNTLDFGALANTADEIVGLRRKKASTFGGYTGELAELDFDVKRDRAHLESVRQSQGPAAASRLAEAQFQEQQARRQKIQFDRSVSLQTIQGQTTATLQRALGLNVQADITDINTSINPQISLARLQGDQQMESLLKRQKGAALLGAVLGGSGPGQSVDAFQAAGRIVSSGSSVGQEGVIAALNRIVENTDLTPTAVVGRN